MKLFKNILHGEVLTLSGVASIAIYIILRLDGKPFEVALIVSTLLGLIGSYCIGFAGAMIEDMSKRKCDCEKAFIDGFMVAVRQVPHHHVITEDSHQLLENYAKSYAKRYVNTRGFYHQQLGRVKRGDQQ